MSKKSKYLSVFIVIASLLCVVENLIPKPLPWIKLGLANIATVVAIYFFDFKFVIKLVVIRVVIGAVITASLFTPSFFLSFSGGISSAVVMYFLFYFLKNLISPFGISIIGAITHLFVQLVMVYNFIIPDKKIFLMTPGILTVAFLSGMIVGLLSGKVINEIKLNKIIIF